MKKTDSNAKFMLMTTAPVEKLIIKYSIPTIISMLITTLYNLADTFYVRQLENDNMIAAIGIVLPLMTILQAFGFFFGHGSGNYISRQLGKKEDSDASKMATNGFCYAVLFGIIIMTFGLFFRKGFSMALGAKTAETIKASQSYMFYILLAAPFMLGSIVINNQLRFQGNALFAMIGLGTGGIINMIIDPFFIFSAGDSIINGSITIPFGLGMGISGAALATGISQVISFILLLIGHYKSDSSKINLKLLSFEKKYFEGIIKGGLPSLVRQGLATVATTCLNHSIGIYIDSDKMIDATQAAMTGSFKIMNFTASLIIGFGQGFQPVCGFNYGAGKYDRVIRSFYFSLAVTFFALLVLAIPGIIFTREIATLIIGSSPEVVEISIVTLRAQLIIIPLMSFVIMCNMFLQTIGKTIPATIVAMSRQGLTFIPLIFILPLVIRLFNGDPLLGIQLCQGVADIFALFIALPFGIKEIISMKRENKTI